MTKYDEHKAFSVFSKKLSFGGKLRPQIETNTRRKSKKEKF